MKLYDKGVMKFSPFGSEALYAVVPFLATESSQPLSLFVHCVDDELTILVTVSWSVISTTLVQTAKELYVAKVQFPVGQGGSRSSTGNLMLLPNVLRTASAIVVS